MNPCAEFEEDGGNVAFLYSEKRQEIARSDSYVKNWWALFRKAASWPAL